VLGPIEITSPVFICGLDYFSGVVYLCHCNIVNHHITYTNRLPLISFIYILSSYFFGSFSSHHFLCPHASVVSLGLPAFCPHFDAQVHPVVFCAG
jgi:hypothetical protein